MNFQLLQEFHYSLTELEGMLPWEREIYLIMLIEDVKEKNEQIRRQQQG